MPIQFFDDGPKQRNRYEQFAYAGVQSGDPGSTRPDPTPPLPPLNTDPANAPDGRNGGDLTAFLEALRINNPQFFNQDFNQEGFGGLIEQFQGIASGEADPRFAAFQEGQFNVLDRNQQGQVGAASELFERRGTGGSTASLNAQNRIRGDFDAQRQALSGQLGLQQLGRQDQFLAGQGDLFAAQNTATEQQLGAITAGLENLTIEEQLNILGVAASNAGDEGGDGGGGITYLCTVVWEKDDMPTHIYEADHAYGQSVDRAVKAGYDVWARPLAKVMRSKKWLYAILKPLILAWAQDMAYCMKRDERPSYVGRMLSFIGYPVCKVLGKYVNWRNVLKQWKSYNPGV